MKLLLMAAATALIPIKAMARQLECNHNYVTHLTIYKIAESCTHFSPLPVMQICSQNNPDCVKTQSWAPIGAARF